MFFYSKNLNLFASASPPAPQGKTDANQTIDCGLNIYLTDENYKTVVPAM